MSESLPDRRKELFGRSADIQALAQRALDKGLTFVTGRPKMGKTWVLQELGRHLAYDEKQWVSDRPKFLVGYHECLGEQDQMLRAVSDLYTRWLEEADHAQQAKSLWTRKSRGDWVEGTAKALGELFEKLDPGKVVGLSVGALVKGTFEKLTAANEELKSGGLVLPKLPYETVRDLVQHLADLAGQRVVIILDGWDQSGSLDHERKLLEAYINHLTAWPDTHMFVGVRHPEINAAQLDTPAHAAAKRIAESSATAEIVELKPLALAASDAESARVLTHLRQLFPKAATLTERQLLELLDGYPGTLNRWRERKDRLNNSPDLLGGLKQIAEDAQAYRYPEFNHYLPKLDDSERILAIRLALILRLDAPQWKKLEPVLNAGLPEDTWRRLVRARVLDIEATHPTYGHDTRHQAARRWFVSQDNLRADVRNEAEQLVVALASKIDRVDATTLPYGASIASIAEAASLADGSLPHALCAAVRTLFGEESDTTLFLGKAALIANLPQAAPLLAIAVVNGINLAKDQNDLPLRDALLNELRRLCPMFLGDTAVREHFATALFNVLHDAKDENNLPRRDSLLDELRQLHTQFPTDISLRERLAEALVNVINDAEDENDLPRRDSLLDELRQLHSQFTDDALLRESLAKALVNVASDADAENDLPRRDSLFAELRRLQLRFSTDPNLVDPLLRGFLVAVNHAHAERDYDRARLLLAEMNGLRSRYADVPAVQEFFAKYGGPTARDS